ncbi:MAG: DUF4139 domain-containing protein [Planctomycetota bacterium]|nr:DUF4139 domain-containing protein [Planctomycetota bacterium]
MSDPKGRKVKQEESVGEAVPITEVVLFSSGVGYFGRAGTVTDNATLELTFSAEQINDLLKSLMVLDLGGGQVSAVSYGSQDPTGKALQAFGLDIANNPSLGSLLTQLRGVAVSVVSPKGKHEGTVLGVEIQRRRTESKDIIEYEVLNLLTSEGITPLQVNELREIQILDGSLQEDLTKALAVLAKSRNKQKKSVSIKFVGEGKRRVRVSYILESPVWKTSYRLLLGDKPLLQGWAIVENTTDSDWNDVRLSLVSGRPISFIQDLYTPLYLERPKVKPQLYAGLRPVAHDEAIEREPPESSKRSGPRQAQAVGRSRLSAPPLMREEALLCESRAREAPSDADYDEEEFQEAAESSLKVEAAGGGVGELFRYTINIPVSIGRQSSAMLPIISQEVEAEKLSIYNSNNHPTHPYNGFKIKNSTGMALLAGPVTVFDEGVYAGDSQIPNLQVGEERLLSYALDLSCTVEAKSQNVPTSLFSVKICRGTIQTEYKQKLKTEYIIKNKKETEKTVLVEHPCDKEWQLKAPEKFEERTDTYFRFRRKVAPNSTDRFEVLTERIQMSYIALMNLDTATIATYASNEASSKQVKEALAAVLKMKGRLDAVTQKKRDLENRKNELFHDQEQIRMNLSKVPRDSKLYTRYLAKLEAQENELDKIEGELEELRKEEEDKRRELGNYIASLEVE